MASKKVSLATIAEQIAKMDARMERGFAAVAGDIARIDDRIDGLATKDQIVALHTQINSIETQLRDMKHVKLQSRVTDLEEEVFGKSRA